MNHSWHAPPGYRVVTTTEVVDSPCSGDTFLMLHMARRRAEKLNALRIIPSYEWRPVRDGLRWRLVAFQNRLERVEGAA